MTDGIPLIHADDRIGASGMQPKSPFAPPPPPTVPPSDGIGLQAAAGRKPVTMRAVPSHDQLADKVSKWGISAKACSGFTRVTARRVAHPPFVGFVSRLRSRRLPDETA